MRGHSAGDVSFVPAVPDQAQLVVRCKPSTRVLHLVLLLCVVLELALLVTVLVLVFQFQAPAPLVFVTPLLGLMVVLFLVVSREYQGLLGPQLAADRAGVWVRTGLGSHPETVFLPWAVIDGIDVAPSGPAVRILSHRGDALFGPSPHWRARSLRRRFGTPFIVDGRRSLEHPRQIVARLHHIATSSALG